MPARIMHATVLALFAVLATYVPAAIADPLRVAVAGGDRLRLLDARCRHKRRHLPKARRRGAVDRASRQRQAAASADLRQRHRHQHGRRHLISPSSLKARAEKAVAALAGPPLNFVVMVRNDGKINSVEDLKGKRIGIDRRLDHRLVRQPDLGEPALDRRRRL